MADDYGFWLGVALLAVLGGCISNCNHRSYVRKEFEKLDDRTQYIKKSYEMVNEELLMLRKQLSEIEQRQLPSKLEAEKVGDK